MTNRRSILFLCVGNSCRSQMAEGFARHLHGDRLEVASAGSAARGVDPRAVRVMAEAGVDISGQRSKNTDELEGRQFDYVITVCDPEGEACPFFPAGTASVHRSFPDPPKLAASATDEEEALDIYRRVRDSIRDYIRALPDSLPPHDGARHLN